MRCSMDGALVGAGAAATALVTAATAFVAVCARNEVALNAVIAIKASVNKCFFIFIFLWGSSCWVRSDR